MNSTINAEVKISPHDPQRGVGDNGGPSLHKLTAKKKIERIQEVLDMDISGTSKLIGISIIADADTDGVTPELSTEDLKRRASVKDRETVYRATRKLDEVRVAKTVKTHGRPNRYLVLSDDDIDAAIDEIEETTPAKPDIPLRPNPTGIITPTSPVQPDYPVRPDPTGGAGPDGSSPQDAPAHAPVHARDTSRATKESPTEINLSEESVGKHIPTPSATRNHTPHMNGIGFVIDERRGAIIPADVVNRWREKFTDIPDLEAAMQNLSCNLLSSLSHKGWSCPEGWMVSILASMNQEAKDKKRITDAKVATSTRKPVKPSRW